MPVVNPKRVKRGAPAVAGAGSGTGRGTGAGATSDPTAAVGDWGEGFQPVRRRDTLTTGLIVAIALVLIAVTQWFWLQGVNTPFIYSEF